MSPLSVDAVNLLAKNNKKIAFVSGLVDDINGKVRFAGYKQGLKDNGIEFNEGLVLNPSINTRKATL